MTPTGSAMSASTAASTVTTVTPKESAMTTTDRSGKRRSRFDPERMPNGEIAAANRSARFRDVARIFGLLTLSFALLFGCAYLNI